MGAGRPAGEVPVPFLNMSSNDICNVRIEHLSISGSSSCRIGCDVWKIDHSVLAYSCIAAYGSVASSSLASPI